MGGAGFNIEILGTNDTDAGSRLVKAALTARRISTIWAAPFELWGALQDFNTRERVKGEILRRYDLEALNLLQGRPGHGVLIKSQLANGTLFNTRLVGVGPDAETVAESDWCSCGTNSNDIFFWITTYGF